MDIIATLTSVLSSIFELVTQNTLLLRGVYTIIIIIAAIIFTKLFRFYLRKFTSGKVQTHYRRTVYRIVQIIVSIAAFFVILGAWGFSPTGLLAGAGFMGIVIGLAAQETLGNVISGILLMFSRPFEIGDWIEISDYSGIVDDISVVNTRIETFDGEVVSIPNRIMSSSEINNKSRIGELRVKKTIGIDYESDSKRAREISEEVMNEQEEILDNPAPKATVVELADSSVNIEILFWIDNPAPGKRRRILSEIIPTIKKKFEAEDIGIPFPHRELIQHDDRSWSLEK
ncbi:MAG: mechanosensitive ion channel family protein [Hadesarchaea archaeon]|nr:mechanosensitive ion channel family protein [Hadesarchaea archaeon]